MISSGQDDLTNDDRAERCHAALETYNDAYDVRSNIIDFLADARHWCDRHGKNFAELDRVADGHYLTEIGRARSSEP